MSAGRPTWGTCAGLILVADRVEAANEGQEFLHGLDVVVHRNYFGAQRASFEGEVHIAADAPEKAVLGDTVPGVFIRAPAILRVGPRARVVGVVRAAHADARHVDFEGKEKVEEDVVVAVRQGGLLGTSFHPELTRFTGWHELFARMVEEDKKKA
jgi:pyridoxal 5'-phosphate synthase pdxT subunit